MSFTGQVLLTGRKLFGVSMLKMRWFFFAVILISLTTVQSVWGFDLTLLHVNDSHSYLDATGDKLKPGGESTYVRLGAWARLATAVNDIRREKTNVVLLHAGDVVQGDLYFMKYGGKPEMEFLDRLGFDAMTLGNHEFDKGADFLAGFLDYARLPVVSANIDAAQVPRLAARLKPYTIVERGKERVGIIGLTIKDTAFISSPGKGVTFMDEIRAARRYVKELEGLGIDKIILLTHVGLDRDKKLAAAISGVDVIVGGHSHSLIGNPTSMKALGKTVEDTYPVVVRGVDGNNVYVVTAWKWGRVLGRLDLTFDDSGRVTAVSGNPVLLLADSFKQKDEAGRKVELAGLARKKTLKLIADSPVAEVVAEDSASAAFLKPYSQGVKSMRNDVIGLASGPVPHVRVPGLDGSGISLPHGSLIAPIVCQSWLDKMRSTGDRADVALQNAGGVRVGLEKGDISVGDIYTLLPFNNTLYTLMMTGQQLKTALEYGVTRGGGAFPYVGGARYVADMNRPEGDRITGVDVLGRDGNWKPLDTSQKYCIVTNAYLARGGDGYEVLKQATDRIDTGFVVAQAFIEYVRKKKVISPSEKTGVTYVPAK